MNMQIGRKIREKRLEMQLSLSEAAEMLDVSPTYLSRLEHGHLVTPPSEAVLTKLADLLDLDADTVLAAAGRIPQAVMEKLHHDSDLISFIIKLEKRDISGAALLSAFGRLEQILQTG